MQTIQIIYKQYKQYTSNTINIQAIQLIYKQYKQCKQYKWYTNNTLCTDPVCTQAVRHSTAQNAIQVSIAHCITQQHTILDQLAPCNAASWAIPRAASAPPAASACACSCMMLIILLIIIFCGSRQIGPRKVWPWTIGAQLSGAQLSNLPRAHSITTGSWQIDNW